MKRSVLLLLTRSPNCMEPELEEAEQDAHARRRAASPQGRHQLFGGWEGAHHWLTPAESCLWGLLFTPWAQTCTKAARSPRFIRKSLDRTWKTCQTWTKTWETWGTTPSERDGPGGNVLASVVDLEPNRSSAPFCLWDSAAPSPTARHGYRGRPWENLARPNKTWIRRENDQNPTAHYVSTLFLFLFITLFLFLFITAGLVGLSCLSEGVMKGIALAFSFSFPLNFIPKSE